MERKWINQADDYRRYQPEIIRLAAVIKKSRKYFDAILVQTGQNYDYNLNGVFFKELGLADSELYIDVVGADLGETMGNIIAASHKPMVELRPDAETAEGCIIRFKAIVSRYMKLD